MVDPEGDAEELVVTDDDGEPDGGTDGDGGPEVNEALVEMVGVGVGP